MKFYCKIHARKRRNTITEHGNAITNHGNAITEPRRDAMHRVSTANNDDSFKINFRRDEISDAMKFQTRCIASLPQTTAMIHLKSIPDAVSNDS